MFRLAAVVMFSCFLSAVSAQAGPYNRNHPYVFYEGNNCTQKRLFSIPAGNHSRNCTKSGNNCSGHNDEARSVRIKFNNLTYTPGSQHYLVVYDDSGGNSRYRDFSRIQIISRPSGYSTLCMPTFEMLKVYDWGNIRYEKRNSGSLKIDGKISRIETRVRPY